MKKATLALAALTLATLANSGVASAASPLSPFLGKFTVDAANCNSVLRDADRVYISVQTSRRGDQFLLIQGYGQDAASEEVLLGEGSRQMPGTSRDVHGEVTQSWTTRIKQNALRSNVNVSRPSIDYRGRTLTTIFADEDSLEIEVSEKHNAKEEITNCRLFRD